MWNVCELETIDDTFDEETLSEFFVSRVPKDWIFTTNEGMFCRWPSKNPDGKIKSMAPPQSTWKIYKCRILMNGELYDSYRNAKEAEIIGQNYSTITAHNVSVNRRRLKRTRKNVRHETLKFKKRKSDFDEFKNTTSSDGEQSDEEINSSDDTNQDVKTEIIGNDSFEFNEQMKYLNYYESKNPNLVKDKLSDKESSSSGDYDNEIENEEIAGNETFILNKNLDEHKQSDVETISSINSDQDSFNFNRGSFLTSTLLEAPTSSQSEIAFIRDIENIKANVRTYSNNIVQQLDHLKTTYLASGISNFSIALVPEPPKSTSNRDNPLKSDLKLLDKNGSVPTMKSVTEPLSVPSDSISIPVNPVKSNLMTSDLTPSDPTGVNTLRKVAHSEELIKVPSTDSIDITDVPRTGIVLPIFDCDEFTASNNALKKFQNNKIRELLVNSLADIEADNEDTFNRGVIEKLFEHKFFMKKVLWMDKTDHSKIKGSEILKCWIESFFKKFNVLKAEDEIHSYCKKYKNTEYKKEKKKEKKKMKLDKKQDKKEEDEEENEDENNEKGNKKASN